MFDQKFQKRLVSVAAVLLAVSLLAMTVAVMGGFSAEASGPGEPDPGTVVGVTTWTLYPSTAITGNTTIYSASPKWYRGLDLSRVKNYNSVDVFVTVDINGTGTLTVTPQVSADGSNWANATYNYVADTLAQTTSVLTSTGVTTATSTTSSSSAVTEGTYQIVLSADGSDYLRMPVIGEYIRFSLAYSGTMTPTIDATLRNN